MLTLGKPLGVKTQSVQTPIGACQNPNTFPQIRHRGTLLSAKGIAWIPDSSNQLLSDCSRSNRLFISYPVAESI